MWVPSLPPRLIIFDSDPVLLIVLCVLRGQGGPASFGPFPASGRDGSFE